jgi:branched-subunit amino acid permease
MAPILTLLYPFLIAMALLNVAVYSIKYFKVQKDLKKQKKAA